MAPSRGRFEREIEHLDGHRVTVSAAGTTQVIAASVTGSRGVVTVTRHGAVGGYGPGGDYGRAGLSVGRAAVQAWPCSLVQNTAVRPCPSRSTGRCRFIARPRAALCVVVRPYVQSSRGQGLPACGYHVTQRPQPSPPPPAPRPRARPSARLSVHAQRARATSRPLVTIPLRALLRGGGWRPAPQPARGATRAPTSRARVVRASPRPAVLAPTCPWQRAPRTSAMR